MHFRLVLRGIQTGNIIEVEEAVEEAVMVIETVIVMVVMVLADRVVADSAMIRIGEEIKIEVDRIEVEDIMIVVLIDHQVVPTNSFAIGCFTNSFF